MQLHYIAVLLPEKAALEWKPTLWPFSSKMLCVLRPLENSSRDGAPFFRLSDIITLSPWKESLRKLKASFREKSLSKLISKTPETLSLKIDGVVSRRAIDGLNKK